MAYSTEVGSELSADHRLIELLCRQLNLETDPARRQAMADRIASIIDWHEMFDRRYLGAGAHDDTADASAAPASSTRPNEPNLAPADLGGSRPTASPHATSTTNDEPSDAADSPLPFQSLLARARRHIREEEDHTLPEFESQAHWMVLEDLGERAREIRLAHTNR